MKVRYRQCPFLNDDIKERMKKRDNLHKLARQTRMQCDWEKFCMCRESVKRNLREVEGNVPPVSVFTTEEDQNLIDQEVLELLAKQAVHFVSTTSQNKKSCISYLFVVAKKVGGTSRS